MVQPSNATVTQLKPAAEDLKGYAHEEELGGLLEVTDLTPGMMTSPPRSSRASGSSLSIINGRIRDGGIARRGGYPDFITKPDSNPIMRLISFHGEGNDNRIVRVSNGGLHVANTTANWTSYTGTPYSIFLRTDYAQILGNLYLSNPSKKIISIDFLDQSYAELSDVNAPTCKYITSFAERILAAYIYHPTDGELPFGLQWSINADPSVWTGNGSGSENLIQSPSDTGDEITGLFTISNVGVIMRERSIWLITRQPFSSAPFRFTAVANIGCDMPWSIARVSDEQGKVTGLIFADNRTRGIYSFTPGSRPKRLDGSVAVEDQLFTTMTDPKLAVGTYDPRNENYHIGLPTTAPPTTDLQKFWVVNIKYGGAILADDGPVCTSIDVVTDIGAPLMIDDLVGVIDDLTGVIDDLGGVFKFEPILVKGDTAGQSIVEDDDEAGAHTFTWTSQDLGSVSRERLIKIVQIAISASGSGNTIFEWSTDAVVWTTLKTFADVSALSKIGFKKQLRGDRIYWRVTSLAPDFTMTEWWAKVQELGLKDIA